MSNQQTDPGFPGREWGDSILTESIFGLKRPYLYVLAGQGRIDSISIRQGPEKRKGKRLFHLGSIRDFLARELAAQKAASVERAPGAKAKRTRRTKTATAPAA